MRHLSPGKEGVAEVIRDRFCTHFISQGLVRRTRRRRHPERKTCGSTAFGGATALSGATTVSVLRQPSVAAYHPTPYIHLGILKVKEVMEGPPAKLAMPYNLAPQPRLDQHDHWLPWRIAGLFYFSCSGRFLGRPAASPRTEKVKGKEEKKKPGQTLSLQPEPINDQRQTRGVNSNPSPSGSRLT